MGSEDESCASGFGGIRESIIKAERQFVTPGNRCTNFPHAEIRIVGFCKDTEKSVADKKKRQDSDLVSLGKLLWLVTNV